MADDTLKVAHASGWPLIVTGVISMIAGVLAIAYPDKTLLAIALITGINVFLLGLMGIVAAVTADDDDATPRVLIGVLGILGVLAGLLVMRRPGETVLVVLLAVGIWLILSGLIEGIIALREPEDRVLRLFAALVNVVLGGLLLALPELSLGTVAVLCGLAFLVRGAFAVYAGLMLRGDGAGARGPQPAGVR